MMQPCALEHALTRLKMFLRLFVVTSLGESPKSVNDISLFILVCLNVKGYTPGLLAELCVQSSVAFPFHCRP